MGNTKIYSRWLFHKCNVNPQLSSSKKKGRPTKNPWRIYIYTSQPGYSPSRSSEHLFAPPKTNGWNPKTGWFVDIFLLFQGGYFQVPAARFSFFFQYWRCDLPSLKLTANAPENGPGPKRKRESLPTINFQGRKR